MALTPLTMSAYAPRNCSGLPRSESCPSLRGIGQAHQFLLQALHDGADVVDGLFHLLVIALVGVRDQLVDFPVGDLAENAVALADGQQDRIQHLVDALHHLAMHALKLLGLAALVETTLAGCLHQAQDLL